MATVDVAERPRTGRLIPHTPEAGDPYFVGTCYERLPVAQEWEIGDAVKYPYLTHIKSLSTSWKSLRHLADFMEVGTTPLRWRDLQANQKEREERVNRTNVTLLEYNDLQPPRSVTLKSAQALKETLDSLPPATANTDCIRLFLVEDLSRQVIELLGSRFNIDPLFFREQINEYTWYNTRDPWAAAPHLLASNKHRQWFRLRNVRLRYFTSDSSFQCARQEANTFNVLRRPDDDNNHWLYLDAPGSIVTITRTRTTIWIGKDEACGGGTVAIVLIDPTVREGSPLWYGHSNWLPTPSIKSPASTPPMVLETLFDTIKQATEAYPWFTDSSPDNQQLHNVLAKPTLYTICAEWLVICDYAKARLGQIEWELEKPSRFRSKGDIIDRSLQRLHVWRRVLPVFREMVTETIEQALPAASRLTSSHTANGATQSDGIEDIIPDYERIRNALNELLSRVDRLTSVVTAEISIEDSRRGLEENHNLARLTWLATTFIPLTFISGLFSMQADISSMRKTFGWYFLAAIPFTAIILLVAGKAGRVPRSKKKPNVALLHDRKVK